MPTKNGTETRRSGRVTLRVPLRIYEPDANKWFLVEEAYSVKVSLWGGLIALSAPVDRNQKLLLANQAAEETVESRVVYQGPPELVRSQGRLVAVEFLRPTPRFWGVDFPSVVPTRARAAQYAN
jgi:hypothetical protein